MKRIILTIAAVATLMSCTPEDKPQVEQVNFTGVYQLEKFVRINSNTGEVIADIVLDCPYTWTFENFNLNKKRYGLYQDECIYKYMTDINYSSETEGVIVIGNTEFDVIYVEDFIVIKNDSEQYTLTQL